MAFKLVLFVAVCLAQGLAFDPLRALQRGGMQRGEMQRGGCTNPSVSFTTEVQEAVDEMDALRDEVSMAAMEAYATGKDIGIAVACFAQQSPRYIKLGVVLARKMRDASIEIGGDLREKSVKYGERMAGPVKALAVTFTTVPVRVYEYIQNKQFLKAALLMLEARKVIKKNSILLAEVFSEMVAEVPEMAERVNFLAKDFFETASTNSRAIREAYAKCVEEGGPKRPVGPAELEGHENPVAPDELEEQVNLVEPAEEELTQE